MTKKEIYWDVYFVSVGIATLMTKEEVIDSTNPPLLPYGLCSLFRLIDFSLRYLPDKPPQSNSEWPYWFPPGDWKARAEFMKEELRKLYKK